MVENIQHTVYKEDAECVIQVDQQSIARFAKTETVS